MIHEAGSFSSQLSLLYWLVHVDCWSHQCHDQAITTKSSTGNLGCDPQIFRQHFTCRQFLRHGPNQSCVGLLLCRILVVINVMSNVFINEFLQRNIPSNMSNCFYPPMNPSYLLRHIGQMCHLKHLSSYSLDWCIVPVLNLGQSFRWFSWTMLKQKGILAQVHFETPSTNVCHCRIHVGLRIGQRKPNQ